jgi:hypothetical protein
MRTALLAALLLSTPAYGAECAYWNAANTGRIVVSDDHMTLYGATPAEVERCGLNEDPNGIRFATCESGWQAEYVFGASTPSGTESDILAFYGTFWYWRCE